VCVLIIHEGLVSKLSTQEELWYESLVTALVCENGIRWINTDDLKAVKRDRDGQILWSDNPVRNYSDAEAWMHMNMQTDRADVCALAELLRILQRQYCEAAETTADLKKWLVVIDSRSVRGSADMRELMHVVGCLQTPGAERYSQFILSLCSSDLLTSSFETGLLGERSKTFKTIAEFGHEMNPSRKSSLYTTRRPRASMKFVMQGGQYSFGAFVLSPELRSFLAHFVVFWPAMSRGAKFESFVGDLVRKPRCQEAWARRFRDVWNVKYQKMPQQPPLTDATISEKVVYDLIV